MNKAIGLALLLGALAAAAAFAPSSRTTAPEPGRQVHGGAISPVVIEASAPPVEAAAPAGSSATVDPDTTTILMPSRRRAEAKVSPAPGADNRDGERLRLVRDLQRELKRVGCYLDDIDGEWTPGTRKALKDFTDHVSAPLPDERPDPSQLVLVQSQPDIVCREACPAGETMTDGYCRASLHLPSESKKLAPPAPASQIVWTKSYVTPARPEPEVAEAQDAALPAEAPPRAEPPPRPRRHTSRPTGVGALLFGIFKW